jgi:hypothetical protein
LFTNLKFITFELSITKKNVMVKVYFEMDNGGYAELVGGKEAPIEEVIEEAPIEEEKGKKGKSK